MLNCRRVCNSAHIVSIISSSLTRMLCLFRQFCPACPKGPVGRRARNRRPGDATPDSLANRVAIILVGGIAAL
eukprot:4104854-Pyramimonas_sp.AAC.1